MISALEFFQTKKRMCESYGVHCNKCPLSSDKNGTKISCLKFLQNYPEKAIEIVENWAKENPVKTYKDVLLEKLPRCNIDKFIKGNCLETFFGICIDKCQHYARGGHEECKECWNQEYKE